jgi:hypothetical protein
MMSLHSGTAIYAQDPLLVFGLRGLVLLTVYPAYVDVVKEPEVEQTIGRRHRQIGKETDRNPDLRGLYLILVCPLISHYGDRNEPVIFGSKYELISYPVLSCMQYPVSLQKNKAIAKESEYPESGGFCYPLF